MAINQRFIRWEADKIAWLKQNYNRPYSELESYLGKTKRAIKHKVSELGLKRDERRPWLKEEDKIILSNPGLISGELHRLIPNKSVVSIAARKRLLLGTARRKIVLGKTNEVAWLLGAIFSDGHTAEGQLSFTQKARDVAFLEKVKDVLSGLGLKVVIKCDGDYCRLWCCSVEFRRILGKKSWDPMSFLKKIDSGFVWLKKEPFVWYFLGGVIDGDGSVHSRDTGNSKSYLGVEVAMKGTLEKEWFSRLLFGLGYSTSKTKYSLRITGGESKVKEFLKKASVGMSLARKSSVSFEFDLAEGVNKINYNLAREIIAKYHYLGTLPVGVRCYGYVEKKKLIGVAAFGCAVKTKYFVGKRVLELKRFVLVENRKNLASMFLGALLRELKKDNLCDVVVSYADSDFHTGSIYKAVGFKEVSRTGESMIYVAEDGRKFSGRYAIECIKAAGYDPTKMKIELGAGKIKFLKEINI